MSPEHALDWVIDRLAETVGEQRIDGMDRNRDRFDSHRNGGTAPSVVPCQSQIQVLASVLRREYQCEPSGGCVSEPSTTTLYCRSLCWTWKSSAARPSGIG